MEKEEKAEMYEKCFNLLYRAITILQDIDSKLKEREFK